MTPGCENFLMRKFLSESSSESNRTYRPKERHRISMNFDKSTSNSGTTMPPMETVVAPRVAPDDESNLESNATQPYKNLTKFSSAFRSMLTESKSNKIEIVNVNSDSNLGGQCYLKNEIEQDDDASTSASNGDAEEATEVSE